MDKSSYLPLHIDSMEVLLLPSQEPYTLSSIYPLLDRTLSHSPQSRRICKRLVDTREHENCFHLNRSLNLLSTSGAIQWGLPLSDNINEDDGIWN